MNVTAAAATTAPVRQWSRLLKSSSSASTSLIISHGSSSTIWTVWSVSLFHYSCRSTITPKQWVSCSKYATSTFDFSGRDRFGVQSLRSQGHGASYASLVASVDDSGPSGEESDGAEKKSKNQKKREARKAVKWAMDLANFTPSQIKKILRLFLLFHIVRSSVFLLLEGAKEEVARNCSPMNGIRNVACGLFAVWAVSVSSPVVAAQRLPPLSTDPDRCERAFVGNTIGQANGVYDKFPVFQAGPRVCLGKEMAFVQMKKKMKKRWPLFQAGPTMFCFSF